MNFAHTRMTVGSFCLGSGQSQAISVQNGSTGVDMRRTRTDLRRTTLLRHARSPSEKAYNVVLPRRVIEDIQISGAAAITVARNLAWLTWR